MPINYKIPVTHKGVKLDTAHLKKYQQHCHQLSAQRARKARNRCVTIVCFIVIYGFVMSCKKSNNVCNIEAICWCVFRDINSIITPSWMHKQCTTPINILFRWNRGNLTIASVPMKPPWRIYAYKTHGYIKKSWYNHNKLKHKHNYVYAIL